jgi:hypothetical protein
MSFRVVSALSTLASVVAACSGEAMPDESREHPPFDVRYQTMYVDVAPGFDAAICRGSLLELDRHVEAVASQLELVPQQRITLYWFSPNADGATDDDIHEWCEDDDVGGCYRGDAVIYSYGTFVYHELVHALVIPAWGGSKKLFHEGAAEGFYRQTDYSAYFFPTHSVKSDDLPSEHVDEYGFGHFSRWLVDEFGPARYRELFGNAKPTDGDVFALVEAVYDTPLQELEQDYLATAPDLYPAPGLCDGLTHIPWDVVAGRWKYETTVDCNAPEAFGPIDGDGRVDLSVTLDIPDEPDVLWTVWNDGPDSISMIQCLDAPVVSDDGSAYPHVVGTTSPRTLSAGKYRLVYRADPGDSVNFMLCAWNGKQPSNNPNATDPDICVK